MEHRLPTGELARSTSWREENGRYYVVYNESVRMEISRDEYRQSTGRIHRAMFEIVALLITLNAFLAWALLWWPRERSSPTSGA